MKQVRIIGLILLAAFVLGAFAASGASAEEGLLPQQGAKEGSGEGGPGTLETLGGEPVFCSKVSILNVLFLKASAIHGTADLHFKGCTLGGLFAVNTLLDESGVILIKVLFLLCLVNAAQLVFGLLLEPQETVHYEVTSLGTLILAKGAVIAYLLSSLEGKELTFTLSGQKGDQKTALSCELAGKTLSHTLVLGKDSGSDEDGSWNTTLTLRFTEIVKLMDV